MAVHLAQIYYNFAVADEEPVELLLEVNLKQTSHFPQGTITLIISITLILHQLIAWGSEFKGQQHVYQEPIQGEVFTRGDHDWVYLGRHSSVMRSFEIRNIGLR
jgi:hypothetical protein